MWISSPHDQAMILLLNWHQRARDVIIEDVGFVAGVGSTSFSFNWRVPAIILEPGLYELLWSHDIIKFLNKRSYCLERLILHINPLRAELFREYIYICIYICPKNHSSAVKRQRWSSHAKGQKLWKSCMSRYVTSLVRANVFLISVQSHTLCHLFSIQYITIDMHTICIWCVLLWFGG